MHISYETAKAIAYAYRDIEAAEVMIADVKKAIENHREPDFRDAFGRPQRGLQLGVPSGESSHRVFNVQWEMALPILQAHIAKQKALIAILEEKAAAETA